MPPSSSETLLFVGCATLDSIALVQDYPAADSRTVATDFSTAGGGPAATAAVAAARAGAQTAFAGVIGTDEEGDRIISGLEAEGVDTSAVIRDPNVKTGASVIVVSRATESRAIVTGPCRRSPSGRGAAFTNCWTPPPGSTWTTWAGTP